MTLFIKSTFGQLHFNVYATIYGETLEGGNIGGFGKYHV